MAEGDETCCLITKKTRGEHATDPIGLQIYTAYHEFNDVDPKMFVDHSTQTNA